jgi:drug/metabolite transporter (DMT)-like permease
VSVLLALLSAVFYGAADFCGGLASRRSAILAVTLFSQSAGFVALLLVHPFISGHAVATDYLFGAFGGVCGGIGSALLYHALSTGKMGVVSPITAVLAASVPLGVGVVRGEQLSLAQIFGLILALVAIVLISLSHERPGEREIATAGVREALGSGVFLGAFLVFLSYTHPAARLDNLLSARVASIAVLSVIALASRAELKAQRADWPLIAGAGVLDITANALYVLATLNGYLSIAAVLTSLYPASTVLLARIALNERLARVQKAGVAFALAGVVLVSVR